MRAFGATLMPGLVRNHERAARMNDSPFMKDIQAQIEKAGVIVLSDAWLAGAVASKKGCIRTPDDMKGLKIRSAGRRSPQMWQAAGASIVSIPSNEVYNALQTGVAEATDTSTGSFVSFRIYEQVKCVTAPGDNALWFMYEPVLMSKKSFDRLDKKQQDVLLEAGKKAQEYFARKPKGSTTRWSRLQGPQGRGRHAHAGRVRRLDEGREAELVRRVRQGSARRQAADRRRAQRQVTTRRGAATWTASSRAVRRGFALSGVRRRRR